MKRGCITAFLFMVMLAAVLILLTGCVPCGHDTADRSYSRTSTIGPFDVTCQQWDKPHPANGVHHYVGSLEFDGGKRRVAFSTR